MARRDLAGRSSRKGESRTLTRDITWGDQVFSAGLTVQSEGSADIFTGWYPWRKVGLGAQYKYYKYRYERSALSTALGGNVTYQGAQGYVSLLF